jgi:PKD repeat protein
VTLTFAWEDANKDGIVDGTSKLESNIFLLKDGNQITPVCAVNPNCNMSTNLLTLEVSSLSHFELVAPVNEPPANVAIIAPAAPVAVNQAVAIQVGFTDAEDANAHAVAVDWGDGNTTSLSTGSLNTAVSHIYQSAGVYKLKATVTDSAGASAQAVYQYVVIYDPNGGFVTGSGWINSPAGAYTRDSTLTGKAAFGFVSKYLKGANVPTGSTEFQFKVGNLNFKSTAYDWLVIAGTKAQYKGSGTINGAGSYGFMLTAIDGTPDKFRIKIWDKIFGVVVYDNMLGAADDATPGTALEGGSIVIHKEK